MTTFLGLPATSLDAVTAGDIVVLGVDDATPYEAGKRSHAAGGAGAIREASRRYGDWHGHHDFDTGRPMLEPAGRRLLDAGDIATDPTTPAANRQAIEAAVSGILGAGATPIVLGGDDSVPIPVFAAYREHGPIWIVQIDAHIDWRDERYGERLGWSSPMRRASEMPWVAGMVQIGARGVGSARREEVEAARAWGAHLVTAREVHEGGMVRALAAVPAGASVVCTLDCDGLDPSVMPGVVALAPGGLSHWHIVDLFAHLATRTRLVGFDLVELAAERDPSGLTSLAAVRFITLAIAAMARSEQKA
ncbi:MAG: arginase family protein [Hyphomicrobiaceae bacterium]